MPTALTQLAALNAPAKVDLREMESIAQVSPTVRNVIIIFFKVFDEFHFSLYKIDVLILFRYQ